MPEWSKVSLCPGCGNSDFAWLGALEIRHYRFGVCQIDLPQAGIPIYGCERCGLSFKGVLPDRSFLTQLLHRHGNRVWVDDYNFASERAIISSLISGGSVDLLDVGGGHGEWLRNMSDLPGRKSVLDVVNQRADLRVTAGEFIQGMADDPDLVWSGEPYDVVTAFDVFEHYYDPVQAMKNLAGFVKRGGYLVVETGNTGSAIPSRYGLNRWWYCQLIDHHVFWNPTTIKQMGFEYGFQLVGLDCKRHKGYRWSALGFNIRQAIGEWIFIMDPDRYASRAKGLSPFGTFPANKMRRDHFRAIFKRV